MIVCVGGILTKGHRRIAGGIIVRNKYRSGCIVEESRVPEVVCSLPSEFCTYQHCVTDASRKCRKAKVGLVEKVSPLGGVVVGRYRYARLVGSNSAGNVVLIDPVVIAKHDSIAQIEPAELAIQQARDQIHSDPCMAVIWISEVGGDVGVRRSALKGWNSAISRTPIVEMFEGQIDFGGDVRSYRYRRRDSITFKFDRITKTTRVLVKAIHAEGEFFG